MDTRWLNKLVVTFALVLGLLTTLTSTFAQANTPSTVLVTAIGPTSLLNVRWIPATGTNQAAYSIRGSGVVLVVSRVVGLDFPFGFPHAHVTATGTANGSQVVIEADAWQKAGNKTGTARFTLALQSNPGRLLYDSGYMSGSLIDLRQ